MAAKEKILWVVHYGSLKDFVARAAEVHATGVAVRTDNDIKTAIPAFHAKGIKIFGWRWPSAKHDSAMAEASRVVDLLGAGMDGYFVDPEGARGKPYDWDQEGLEGLAKEFCETITKAAPGKPFGTTSHYRAKKVFPNLPWSTFLRFSSVLLPQAYWRSDEGEIGHGLPDDNYRVALDQWAAAGGDKARIVPMAGELASSTAAEIATHAQAATTAGIETLHFYAYDTDVDDSVWNAVAKA